MNKLQIINEQQVLGKDFKVYGDFDNPLFLAKDVAEWIEHNNVTLMVNKVDEEEKKLNYVLDNSGQRRKSTFLTEDGLYEVLMQSRKPIAKQFKKEVKKILKSLRRGETKIVEMTEYQKMMINSRNENAKVRKAQLLERIAKRYEGTTYEQVLHAYATKEIEGDFVLPLPKTTVKTYSATDIANMLGTTPQKIGKLSNDNKLKVEEYGSWFKDKAKNCNKEVTTFRYFENVIPIFKDLLN